MSNAADTYLDLPAGKTVFVEGDAGQTMYIIESGAVDIVLAARGKQPIAQLGPGEFFGEMSMLDDQPRFASAIASEPCRLLKVERADLPELLESERRHSRRDDAQAGTTASALRNAVDRRAWPKRPVSARSQQQRRPRR